MMFDIDEDELDEEIEWSLEKLRHINWAPIAIVLILVCYFTVYYGFKYLIGIGAAL